MKFEIIEERCIKQQIEEEKYGLSRRAFIKNSSGLLVCTSAYGLSHSTADAQYAQLARVIGKIVTIDNLIALGQVISPTIELINKLIEDSRKPVQSSIVDGDGDIENQITKSFPIKAQTAITVQISLTPSSDGRKKFRLKTAINTSFAGFRVS